MLLNKDDLLVQLCQHMLREFELIPGWRKLIAVGRIGAGHTGLSGYSFDLTGNWEAGSPNGFDSLRSLKQLCQSMATESRDDPDRWSHTPDNYQDRIKEYAALPV